MLTQAPFAPVDISLRKEQAWQDIPPLRAAVLAFCAVAPYDARQ
jgi:hypothetical protein